jgi:hypothetical protein
VQKRDSLQFLKAWAGDNIIVERVSCYDVYQEQAMPFAGRYLYGLNAFSVRDDEQHKLTEVLAAAALCEAIGQLEQRVRFDARTREVRRWRSLHDVEWAVTTWRH